MAEKDYISREAVLALTDDYELTLPDDEIFFEYIDPKKVATIPAADVRPVRRGKWEIKKASIHPYGNDVCCSECGFTMGSSFGYNFCPNCGAMMEES